MDPNFQQVSSLRSKVRKFSKIPEKTLLKKRMKNKFLSIDESTLKAYSQRPFLKRMDTSRKRKKLEYSLKTTEKTPTSAKISTKFPSIESLNAPMSKVRMSLKGKEDKLDALINNFIGHKPATTKRFKERLDVEFLDENAQVTEQKFYEKNLENFRGREMIEYQNDLEKNLKIEKIRLRSYKKTRERLQSM
jgi:hypothetical protein